MSTSSPTGPRTFPRIKAVWGTTGTIAAHWRLGLFGFYERIHGFPRSGFAISVRGLLVWSALFAVMAYVGFAAAATYWFRRNAYNTIQFTDMLTWPVRRPEVARLRAQAWLAQGRDAMKAGRWGEGTFYLRRGLEVVSDDFESRSLLASFYVNVGDRNRGLALIEEGLVHGLPTQSGLEAALNVAAAGEDWEIALRICDRGLDKFQQAGKWTDRQWLLSRKLGILNRTGRAAEGLPLAEAAGDAALTPVKIERAKALVLLGRAREADELLLRWRKAAGPNDARLMLREQVNVRREAADFDGMDQLLAELRSANPGRPEPMALAVEQRARAQRQAGATLDDYIFRFGTTAENLMLVAQPLAGIPDFALLQRVDDAARERGYDLRPFRMLEADARLSRGDTTNFIRLVEEVHQLPARPGRDHSVWLQWSRLLVDAITSPHSGPADPLLQYFGGRPLGLASHQLTASALKRAGKLTTARDLLVMSRRLYPSSKALIDEQTEIEGALTIAAAAAPANPAPEAIAVAADWNEFVRPVDAAVSAGQWDEARRLVRQLRQASPAPAWLAAHESEVVWRELCIAHALQDALALQLATRAYVNGSLARSNEILALAREWQAAGSFNDATFVVRAVLEKSPEHALAKKQFQSLTQKGK